MQRVLQTILASTFLNAMAFDPAHSQQGGRADSEREPCVAQPEGEGETAGKAGMENDAPTLTEKLARCDGVLEPPPVGDTELVEPAPDEGVTPIIPPDDLPDDQPRPAERFD